MNASSSERIAIAIDDRQQVSGLLRTVPGARACYVFGHGAGAGLYFQKRPAGSSWEGLGFEQLLHIQHHLAGAQLR